MIIDAEWEYHNGPKWQKAIAELGIDRTDTGLAAPPPMSAEVEGLEKFNCEQPRHSPQPRRLPR